MVHPVQRDVETWGPFRSGDLPVFAETGNPRRVNSGFSPNVRTIFVTVTLPASTTRGSGWTTIRMTASRYGAPYTREFSLRVGEVAIIDADRMMDTEFEVIANGINKSRVQITGSPNPPDGARRRLYPRYQAIADGGSNTVLEVPGGALSVVPADTFALFEWVAYNASNTVDYIAQPQAPGVEVDALSPLFRPGANASGGLLWRVEL